MRNEDILRIPQQRNGAAGPHLAAQQRPEDGKVEPVRRLRRDDEVDGTVGQEMQVFGRRLPEGDVRLGSGRASLGDHRRGWVDAGDVLEVGREGAGADAGAAAEIDGVVGGAVVVVDDGAEDAGGEGGAEGGVGGGGEDLLPGKAG